MYQVIVFAGTTEGNEVCAFLQKHRILACACVATGYGTKSLTEDAYLTVQGKRLSREEMEDFFRKEQPEMVIDATHPYAAEVTANIKGACEEAKVSYVRVLRRESGRKEKAVYVESTEAAAEYLNTTRGNVLLTTGSKELKKFTAVSDYRERLFARVLSLPSVMQECAAYGFEGKHLIGMQGPFSKEMNAATLRQYQCRYLVTKDSGQAGGFEEKIEAAQECGATPIIIGRPVKESGISVAECKRLLCETFPVVSKPAVTVLGIGMGGEDTLTIEGKKALEQADLVIGAKRMADGVKLPHHEVFYEYRSEEIVRYIRQHPEYENVVVALSGDVGFYSGAKKLLALLGENTRVICGISSVSYFMAKIGLSWDDAKIVSAHGRNCNLVSLIRQNEKVFAILGTGDGISNLAKKLVDYKMGEVLLFCGENLSYENEKIFVRLAKDLVDYEGDALSVVCAYNENAVPLPATHGISDGEFIRGKAPMTKEEVRTVSLAKLGLARDSVCYDVGAGTGSVSIEMALRAHQGRVYAIEKKEDALALLQENKIKFGTDNLEVVSGSAPEAMEGLPAPTHAFIGGSSGNLQRIVELLLEKNKEVKIVINCITLETVSEALETIRAYNLTAEMVQIAASRSKSVGRYHMMMGENPIYIITCGRMLP